MPLSAFILIITGVICIVLLLLVYLFKKSYSDEMSGLNEWMLGLFMFVCSVPLFLARGHIPDFLSIIIANLLVITFILLNSAALKITTGYVIRSQAKYMTLFLVSFVLLFGWFTYVVPSIKSRIFVFSIYVLIAIIDQLIFAIKHLPQSLGRNIAILACSVIIISRSLQILIIILDLEPLSALFEDSFFNILRFLMPAIFIPLTTISFILLNTEKKQSQLERQVRYDGLTNCLNKKAITALLVEEIHRVKRQNNKLTIMLLDLDDFKKINDQYGHLVGDQVLLNFTETTQQLLRATDHLGRFGGDEFLLILPNTSADEANLMLTRLITASEKSQPRWSVSIGVSEWAGEHDFLEALLTRADGALYQAKSKGKNQIHQHLKP